MSIKNNRGLFRVLGYKVICTPKIARWSLALYAKLFSDLISGFPKSRIFDVRKVVARIVDPKQKLKRCHLVRQLIFQEFCIKASKLAGFHFWSVNGHHNLKSSPVSFPKKDEVTSFIARSPQKNPTYRATDTFWWIPHNASSGFTVPILVPSQSECDRPYSFFRYFSVFKLGDRTGV